MKRSRLSRGLQVLYLDVIVGLILAAVLAPISGVIVAVTRTEATGALLDITGLISDIVSITFICAGLILLWQVHRGYRYALVAKRLEYVLGFATELPQLSGISTALSLAAVIPGFFYIWLFIRTTNGFLRLKGEDTLIGRGKTVLILWLGSAALSAVVLLLLDPDNMESDLTAAGPTLLSAVVGSVSGIMLLIYTIQASSALKDWSPEMETLPPETPSQESA